MISKTLAMRFLFLVATGSGAFVGCLATTTPSSSIEDSGTASDETILAEPTGTDLRDSSDNQEESGGTDEEPSSNNEGTSWDEDGYSAEDDPGTDESLGDGFAFRVRPGTQMCTNFSGPDTLETYQKKARIVFKPGLWRLPKDKANFPLDWIAKVEFGPGGQTLTPQTSASATRTLIGTPDQGEYRYEFWQRYGLGSQTFEITLQASFFVRDGVAQNPIVEVDDPKVTIRCENPIYARFQAAQVGQAFITCRWDDPVLFSGRTRYEIETDKGDKLRFHLRLSMKCCCFIGHDWGELVKAEFVRADQVRMTDAFFSLAFGAKHHVVYGHSMLAVFDTPVDNVHAVLVTDADQPTASLKYLDSNLQVISTPTIAKNESFDE